MFILYPPANTPQTPTPTWQRCDLGRTWRSSATVPCSASGTPSSPEVTESSHFSPAAPLLLSLASSQPPCRVVKVCKHTFLPPGVISVGFFFVSFWFTAGAMNFSFSFFFFFSFLFIKIKQSISFPSITPNSLCNSIIIATLASAL